MPYIKHSNLTLKNNTGPKKERSLKGGSALHIILFLTLSQDDLTHSHGSNIHLQYSTLVTLKSLLPVQPSFPNPRVTSQLLRGHVYLDIPLALQP